MKTGDPEHSYDTYDGCGPSPGRASYDSWVRRGDQTCTRGQRPEGLQDQVHHRTHCASVVSRLSRGPHPWFKILSVPCHRIDSWEILPNSQDRTGSVWPPSFLSIFRLYSCLVSFLLTVICQIRPLRFPVRPSIEICIALMCRKTSRFFHDHFAGARTATPPQLAHSNIQTSLREDLVTIPRDSLGRKEKNEARKQTSHTLVCYR
ncbi:hypothetical protein LZ32DRAFT_102402 [Colletotrichum eremochloae]|nr:hypothetical protein LZ32DRAFT_102402 [Colletotrichum eremochloae]